MEVPFIKYTANYLNMRNQMICSVLSKWHFHFHVSPHSSFGFFSCVGYLHPKDYIKGVKNLFLNFGLVHDVPLTNNELIRAFPLAINVINLTKYHGWAL